MKSARQIAAEILLRVERDGSYASLSLNGELRKNGTPDAKEAALATKLVYGVIERKITLDYNLSLYLRSPLKKLHPAVLTVLRLGLYQIFYTDRIPDRAAVNESVALTKANGVGYASGLVNAVLRKAASAGLRLPDPGADETLYDSVKYSCPQALLRHLISNYGPENTRRHLEACSEARPLYIRLNPLKCNEETLAQTLQQDGAAVYPTDVPGGYRLAYEGDITRLSAFEKGLFHVQDISSQIAALLPGARPGDTVADCCAAPGGKSFTLAQCMNNTGSLTSCDIYPHKTKLIEDGAKRLGISIIQTVCAPAQTLPSVLPEADAVLCDVPCSGYGVLGRKPELRYKDPADCAGLPQTQYEILSACAGMVRPGGTLVYSTCTLNPAENEAVCDAFLASGAGFAVSDDPFYRTYTGDAPYMTLFASAEGGDGFFAAKFERITK